MSRTFAEFKEDLLSGDFALGFQQGYDDRLAHFDASNSVSRAQYKNPWCKVKDSKLYRGYTQGWQAGGEYIEEFFKQYGGNNF